MPEPLAARQAGRVTGRFAPSPTGPMHFGSLVAALGSYLSARSRGGRWLLRIEDIDPPRQQPGAVEQILDCLESFGFDWDGEVLYQRHRMEYYREIARALVERGDAFYCGCTRRELRDQSEDEQVYPGTCRSGVPAGREPRAIRVRARAQRLEFVDRLQGAVGADLEKEIGDFVIHRADGLPAYQLAVAVDDADQGVTEVVRGSDLLESTLRQIFLQQLLGFSPPDYLHLPVVVDQQGAKLSKQTGAPALDPAKPLDALCDAMQFLGHPVPGQLRRDRLARFWEWAISNWQPGRIPRTRFSAASKTCSRC